MDAVDHDTCAAVLAHWQTDTATLPGLFPRLPTFGMVKSPRAQPTDLPYAAILCEGVPGKTQRYPSGTRKEARKVTIQMYGTKAQMTSALAAVQALFNARMGAPERPKLIYPSGATFIKWLPVGDGSLVQEDDGKTKGGQDVWRALVVGEVTSVRSEV